MHYRAVYYALISIYSPHSPCVPLLMSTYPSCLPDLIFSPMYHILFMPCPLIYILNPSPTYWHIQLLPFCLSPLYLPTPCTALPLILCRHPHVLSSCLLTSCVSPYSYCSISHIPYLPIPFSIYILPYIHLSVKPVTPLLSCTYLNYFNIPPIRCPPKGLLYLPSCFPYDMTLIINSVSTGTTIGIFRKRRNQQRLCPTSK